MNSNLKWIIYTALGISILFYSINLICGLWGVFLFYILKA